MRNPFSFLRRGDEGPSKEVQVNCPEGFSKGQTVTYVHFDGRKDGGYAIRMFDKKSNEFVLSKPVPKVPGQSRETESLIKRVTPDRLREMQK